MSKNKKIYAMALVFLVGIGGMTALLINRDNDNSKITEFEIAILYDDTDSTSIKTEELFTELINVSNIIINRIPISSEFDMCVQIDDLPKSIQFLALIGHGTNESFYINNKPIAWDELKENLLNSHAEKQMILSCCSSNILSNESDAIIKEKFITFENEVDYQIAGHVGAMYLAEELANEDMIYKVHYLASMDLENLLLRAINCTEPLWHGYIHNKLASLARNDLMDQSLTYRLNSELNRYMLDASKADVTDFLYLGLTEKQLIMKILVNETIRNQWLKHSYGLRFGFTICLGLIPIIKIPVCEGTAPESAQIAYDKALTAYKNFDYKEAGIQLSYAVHYGQDMTMPNHVYDSLNLPTIPLIALAVLLNDYMDLQTHNRAEAWASDNWIEISQDVMTFASNYKYEISGSEEDIIAQEVENIALWTRDQVSEGEMRRAFRSDDDARKAEIVKPLLGKGMAYTAALYEKFVKDACNPPRQPDEPESYQTKGNINNDYEFSFTTTDPDGDKIKYEVDWGDGTTNTTDYYTSSGYSTSLSHQWNTVGVYSISVRAYDEHSIPSEESNPTVFNITDGLVNDRPNQPSAPSGPEVGYENGAYDFYFSTTDYNNDKIRYEVDWGDGNVGLTGYFDSGITTSLSHQWNNEGLYFIRVRAQDELGERSSWSNAKNFEALDSSQNHSPNQPNAPSGVDLGTINVNYAFTVSTTDPDGHQIRYLIDWGDGTTNTSDYFNSGRSTSLSHQWSTEGLFSIRVRAQDEHGSWSSWSNIKIFEAIAQSTNHAPNRPNAPSGPNNGNIEIYYSYFFSTTDPDEDQIRYQIDWDDGTTSTSNYFGSGISVSLSHQWSTEGIYFIRVRAQDEHGLWSSWSENLVVQISDIIIVP